MDTYGNNNAKKKGKKAAVIAAVCLIAAVGGGIAVFGALNKNVPEPAESRAPVVTEAGSSKEESSEDDSSEAESVPEKPEIQDWAVELLERNEDVVGWIKIPGIEDDNGDEIIDFPVLQGEDNDYYLYKDIDEEYYESGSIYMDAWSVLNGEEQTDNITVFGHHMGVLGTGFTHLSEYKKGADFLKDHALIEFDSIYENDSKYAIVSCFMINTEEYEDNGNLFEYIGYRDFDDEEYKFDDWYDEITKRSWYSNDIKCTENDKYITLSTCSKLLDSEDLRWVIVAKKLTAQDDVDHIIDSYKDRADEDIYFPQFWIDRHGNKKVDGGWAL